LRGLEFDDREDLGEAVADTIQLAPQIRFGQGASEHIENGLRR